MSDISNIEERSFAPSLGKYSNRKLLCTLKSFVIGLLIDQRTIGGTKLLNTFAKHKTKYNIFGFWQILSCVKRSTRGRKPPGMSPRFKCWVFQFKQLRLIGVIKGQMRVFIDVMSKWIIGTYLWLPGGARMLSEIINAY